ncbi:AI-2E family transporter [Phytoactinopolyspora limicola]|uniref:AI-2E family transporter n=1 Tax=Phytoactinopolyspora limicola TaxID=2715536 RepID=UPI00140A4803|nr:AI-2E family transporter [Phytoactinopolyspora limicola]
MPKLIGRRHNKHDTNGPHHEGADWLQREGAVAWRLLGIGLVIAASVYLVMQIKFIAMAVVLGFAMVSLLWPLARWLRSYKIPAVFASLISVLLFLGFFSGIVFFVVYEVIESWDDMVRSVTGAVQEFTEWFEEGPFGLDTGNIQDLLDDVQDQLGDVLSGVGQAAATGITLVGNFAAVLLIAIFFTIFALTSGDKLWEQFVRTLRPEHQAPAHVAFKASMKTTGNWFYASTVTGLVDGFFIGLGLLILDVPLAVPIGALTFVMGYVPLVGATLAGAFAVMVAFFSGGLSTAIWALLIVLAVQQIEGNVLSPLLMSRAVRFHPLITLVLTTGAGFAFGLVGLFLAIPVAGAITAAIIGWRRKMREQEAAHKEAMDIEAAEREASEVGMPGARVPEVDDDDLVGSQPVTERRDEAGDTGHNTRSSPPEQGGD